ncbi:MAG TPA: ABC transporter permease, partial [Flavisolibacter sp.]|nr:ABC transporter permease [Flavisolibacter sp.]
MFKNYFNIALRNLARNKIYAFINIAGLSIGLACAMLIILYVKDEVSYDRFHNNVGGIYRVVREEVNTTSRQNQKDGNTGYFQGPQFTAGVPGIQAFVRVQSRYHDIKKGTDVTSQELLYVDSNFFDVFSFPLASGSPKTCLSNPYSVVLSEDAAEKHFGTTDAIGKTILLKADTAFALYTVTAVAKKVPQNSSIKFDVLLPLSVPQSELQNGETWFNFFLNTFVVLKPNASIKAVEAQMGKVYEAESGDALKRLKEKFGPIEWKSKYMLQPFTAMHLSKDLPAQNGLTGASNPVYSYILSGIALFILLIACINFVNLTIARSVRRAKEIGIRKVVGGERKQLLFQFLGESFLLCFMAFAFALLLAQAVLPVFNNLSNKALSIAYLLDAKLIAGYI